MLKAPKLNEQELISFTELEFGLNVKELIFLSLGADRNTAVYKVITTNKEKYFLKLRLGNFDITSVQLPKFLKDNGVKQIIEPLETRKGILSPELNNFHMILYPFVEGNNGIKVNLTENQWKEFGKALKQIHSIKVPNELKNQIQTETYSSNNRDSLKSFINRVSNDGFNGSLKAELTEFVKVKKDEIIRLINRTEELAKELKNKPLELVLCHYDIHGGNILIGSNSEIYIVDWDNPIFAPKERDLMFIGGGVGDVWNTNKEIELFYKGYGQAEINPTVLVYYRFERIIEDLAVEAETILSLNSNELDQRREFEYFKSNFLPNRVLDIAYKTEKDLF